MKYLAINQAGQNSPVYTASYIIDKIPPKVVSTNPKNLQTGFSKTGTIAIRFSENIKPSVNWSKIYTKNLTTGKTAIISTTKSGNTLTIKMAKTRYTNNVYRVYLPASAVRDMAGNNLTTGGDVVWEGVKSCLWRVVSGAAAGHADGPARQIRVRRQKIHEAGRRRALFPRHIAGLVALFPVIGGSSGFYDLRYAIYERVAVVRVNGKSLNRKSQLNLPVHEGGPPVSRARRFFRHAWRWPAYVFFARRFFSSSMISPPVWESRLPVGSSASNNSGSLMSARAMATRCCSPPESSNGLWSVRPRRPTRASSSRPRLSAVTAEIRATRAGRQTFSSAVSSGSSDTLEKQNRRGDFGNGSVRLRKTRRDFVRQNGFRPNSANPVRRSDAAGCFCPRRTRRAAREIRRAPRQIHAAQNFKRAPAHRVSFREAAGGKKGFVMPASRCFNTEHRTLNIERRIGRDPCNSFNVWRSMLAFGVSNLLIAQRLHGFQAAGAKRRNDTAENTNDKRADANHRDVARREDGRQFAKAVNGRREKVPSRSPAA